MELYPEFRNDLDLWWSADGTVLHLRDTGTGQCWSLSEPYGELLTSLDGETPPGEGLDLSPGKTFRGLCLFEKYGFLEGLPTFLCSLGTALWLFPCQKLRRQDRSLALAVYHTLIRLLWLPLLVWMIARLQDPAFFLPEIWFDPVRSTLCLILSALVSLVLHELAHAAAANVHRVPVTNFGIGIHEFMPCACTITPELPYASRRIQRAVAMAGPVSNLCLGCLLLILWSFPAVSAGWMFWAGYENLLLCAMNLLPLGGLDGQHLLITFPAMERVWSGTTARCRTAWARFFEGAFSRTLGIVSRLGMAVLIILEVFGVLQPIWEVLFQ